MIARFVLRRGAAADAPMLWMLRADAIRHACRGHYPHDVLERWAASPMPETFAAGIPCRCVVVGEAGNRIAGFAILDRAAAGVEAVFVAPAKARRGLGHRLLVHLEGAARDEGLHGLSLDASLNAVPFYLAAGYHALSQGVHTTSAGVVMACVGMGKTLV